MADPHADALAALRALEREQVERYRPRPNEKPKPLQPIRLLDADPFEGQRRREGEALLGGMRTAGVGSGAEWMIDRGLLGGGVDESA